MFCSHCGKEVAAGAKFCANCGAAVNSQPTPAAEPPKAPAPTAQREVPAVEQVGNPRGNTTGSGGQPEKKKKGVPKKPLIIVAAVLVLIVGFGAVLSLFGDGSEPDSDSKGLDWVENIPKIDSDLGLRQEFSEDEMNEMSASAMTYLDYKKEHEEGFILSGMPANYEIKYIQQGSKMYGFHNRKLVYLTIALYGPLTISSVPELAETEPLIAKTQALGQYIYCLLYKTNDGYLIYVASPADPTSSYLTWTPLYQIGAADKEYCSFLNGEQELEIVSIPGESDNGTLGVSDTGSTPDWSDKIPRVSESYNMIGSFNAIGRLFGYSSDSKPVPYDEISDRIDFHFEFAYLGAPDDGEIEYFGEDSLSLMGVRDGQVVYWASEDVIQGGNRRALRSRSGLPSCEPLIVKNNSGIYYLCYHLDNCYMLYVTAPSDPNTSYLSWTCLYDIYAASKEDCDLLNGAQPLEVVSIPGESGNSDLEGTATKTDTSSPDWVDNIPLVPGGAILYYFEDEGVQAHTRPYVFEEGGIMDFIGYSNSEQMNYHTAEIDGGTVCTGFAPDGAVYAEVWDDCPGPVGDYYFSVVCEYEPVIGRRDDGYCYLFYMREYDSGGNADPYYEMYMVQPTDSPNYEDWNFKAYVHCNNLQYFDYLNGTKELEIISVPGQSTRVATKPTATTPEPPADSNRTSNDGTAGTVDTPALPEGAQYVSKLEEYVADPTSLDLTFGRESDYTSLSLGRQRNMLDYPLDYIGTKAIFSWPLKVLSSGETQNGYRYYAVNEMDNSIAEEEKVDVVLIDVRENASEDVKAIGDEFKSYLVFAGGVHTDEGWYIVFFVTADI